MPVFLTSLLGKVVSVGSHLLFAALVFAVGLFLIRLLLRTLSRSHAYARIDPEVRGFLDSFIKWGLYILLAVSIVPILGIEVASVITVLATAGAAIGLALQGALANFAGGIMPILFKPFKLGDFIEASGVSGTVRAVSVFYTELTTPDNKRVMLPNGALTGAAIINYSAEQTRRVDLAFSVAYGSDPAAVCAVLREAAEADARVRRDPAPFTRLTAQNDSALTFTLRVWVDSGLYWDVYHDLLLAVHTKLGERGIEIPFPQLDVHLRGDDTAKK